MTVSDSRPVRVNERCTAPFGGGWFIVA